MYNNGCGGNMLGEYIIIVYTHDGYETAVFECTCVRVCVHAMCAYKSERKIETEGKKIDNALARAAYGVRYAENNDVSGPSMCYGAKFSFTRSPLHTMHFFSSFFLVFYFTYVTLYTYI